MDEFQKLFSIGNVSSSSSFEELILKRDIIVLLNSEARPYFEILCPELKVQMGKDISFEQISSALEEQFPHLKSTDKLQRLRNQANFLKKFTKMGNNPIVFYLLKQAIQKAEPGEDYSKLASALISIP